MNELNLKENMKHFAVTTALKYFTEDPDEGLPKLEWADKFDRENVAISQRRAFRSVLDNPDGNWYRLIKSFWTDIDPELRATFFENFIVNTALIGLKRQRKAEEKYGCNIPWAILMDPTSACNLHCTGCWAAEYGNKLNMSYETLDHIIHQGKELGTYMYIYSGGEPLVRKKDIIRLCEAHPDCQFLAFTNGTLIDEKFADEMLRVKNFIPAISIEGNQMATDYRRGEGTFQAVVQAMRLLKEKKLPFGASCCYTSKNANGDIEPCAFIHYSDSSIYEKTLLEAYQSPLFMAYKEGQPFHKNLLRHCPMLENPQCLQTMAKGSGAHSTDLQSPESAEHLCEKCVPYAEYWAPIADKLWDCSHNCNDSHKAKE